MHSYRARPFATNIDARTVVRLLIGIALAASTSAGCIGDCDPGDPYVPPPDPCDGSTLPDLVAHVDSCSCQFASMRICNEGNASAPGEFWEFRVTLTCLQSNGLSSPGDAEVYPIREWLHGTALAADQCVEVGYSYVCSGFGGAYTVGLEVDIRDDVDECDEGNLTWTNCDCL